MGAYTDAMASTEALIATLQRALGDSLKLMVDVCPTEGDAEFMLGHWEALQRYAVQDFLECLGTPVSTESARRMCLHAIDKALEGARQHIEIGPGERALH